MCSGTQLQKTQVIQDTRAQKGRLHTEEFVGILGFMMTRRYNQTLVLETDVRFPARAANSAEVVCTLSVEAYFFQVTLIL